MVSKNDIGTVFEVIIKDGTAIVDISGATTKQIIFKKANGETVTKTATFKTDGTDGKIQYTTVTNDLDVEGTWEIQAFVILASGEWMSDVSRFVVNRNL